MIRKQIRFYGRVQGVGFRYKASHIADALGITGFVHNEYDGSVRMEAQGEEAAIDRLLQSLYQDRYIDICDIDVEMLAIDEEERRFRIR